MHIKFSYFEWLEPLLYVFLGPQVSDGTSKQPAHDTHLEIEGSHICLAKFILEKHMSTFSKFILENKSTFSMSRHEDGD